MLIVLGGGLAFNPQAGIYLQAGGWVTVVFFALCGGLAVAQLLPGASFLRLEDAGFTVRSFWRDRFYPWAEIERFGVAKGTSRHDWVGFNMVPGSTLAADAARRELNRSQMGYEAMLPDNYGWATATLADHLNHCRRTCLGLAGPETPETSPAEDMPETPATSPAGPNRKLKFSLGIGSLGLAALMGEIYGKSLPFWITLPVILLPMCIVLFVQPNQGIAGPWVRRLQAFGAVWYLAAAILFSCQFFSADTPRAAAIIYSACLIAGAIPCLLILWRLRTGKQDAVLWG